MMIPKIIFRYSWIYDQRWKDLDLLNKDSYPAADAIKAYIKVVEPLWQKDHHEILEELSNISTLSWQEETITCYVVGRTIPFSDPLTIPIFKEVFDNFIDVLTHELIHQLFIQNSQRLEKSWNYVYKQYKEYAFNTRIHIPLHALHEHISYSIYPKAVKSRY